MKLRKFMTMFMIMTMTAGLMVGCGSSSSDESSEGEASAWDPSMDITIVSREDGSGTRGAFIELFGIEVKDESGECFALKLTICI